MIVPKEIRRSNRNSLALTINEKGDLIVKAPLLMPLDKIYNFINEKEKWIEKKQKNIYQTLNDNSEIVNYNAIYFLGKKYKVEEVKGLNETYLTSEYLAIPTSYTLKTKREYIKQFFIENTREIVLNRAEKLSKKIGVRVDLIKIINSKAKWGMCDDKNQIYINWKTIMLTPELVDYIIVHELCHIKELNHSKQFWNLVEEHMPNYKEHINLIKKSNFLIKLF